MIVYEHVLSSNGRCFVCGEQDPSTEECAVLRMWRSACAALNARASFTIVQRAGAAQFEARDE
jgi:hypothetical protein